MTPPCSWSQCESQDYQRATGHVLSQKVLRRPADDDDGAFTLVLLHMDGRPITDIIANENLPPTHRVTDGITCPPMDNQLTAVHRVAATILGVAVHYDARSIHERRQVVARRAVDVDLDRVMQVGAHVALTAYVVQLDPQPTALSDLAQLSIQIPVVDLGSIDP
jgi:hypothetical protein